MILEAIMQADFKKSVIRFNEEVINSDSIIFLGDSIIKYYDTSKYYSNTNIINRGIAGDTATYILDRIGEVISKKPSIVILNAGSNDLVRTKLSHDEIVKNILKIKYLLEEGIPNVVVYILSLPPVLRDHEVTNMDYMKHRTNDDINTINEELDLYTNLVDTHSLLVDSDGNLDVNYTTDGLHLNDLGYKVFSKVIANSVKELV